MDQLDKRAVWPGWRAPPLPASLASIGAYAFAGFEKLSEVCYAGTPEQWAEISIGEGNDVLLPAIRFGAA